MLIYDQSFHRIFFLEYVIISFAKITLPFFSNANEKAPVPANKSIILSLKYLSFIVLLLKNNLVSVLHTVNIHAHDIHTSC